MDSHAANTAAIVALVGILMPIIIAIVKQVRWPWWANLIVAIIACGIAGVVTVWARGELTWQTAPIAVAAVFIAAQATYNTFWASSGIETKINDLTSIVK
jgi:hypothetical protein